MKQAYRRWVCGLLACLIALLAVCGAVVYVVDPCLYYRVPDKWQPVLFNERYQMAKESTNKYLDARVSNIFALKHAQGIYEHQRAACSTKRVANLTRSGSLGSQRYGTILWSGDIAATWDVLKHQIAEGRRLMEQNGARERMRQAQKENANPQAAAEIVHLMEQLCEEEQRI